jgi:hypothetical protein
VFFGDEVGPGRDWVTPVLQRYDIWGRFAALWKARAGKQ